MDMRGSVGSRPDYLAATIWIFLGMSRLRLINFWSIAFVGQIFEVEINSSEYLYHISTYSNSNRADSEAIAGNYFFNGGNGL